MQIQINNLSVISIQFYLPEEDCKNERMINSLSFSLIPLNESFSIIHQLYKSHQIEEMIFAFTPLKDIYLGKIPESIIKNKSSGECSSVNGNWGCELNNIFFENEKIEERKYILPHPSKSGFNNTLSGIYAPIHFLNLVEEEYFKKYIDNGNCDRKNKNTLECWCESESEIFDTFPSTLNFIFDNSIFTIPKKIFFEIKELKCLGITIFKFLIFPNQFQINNIWIFGDFFLQNYVTIFDYNRKKVSFYSDSPTFKITNT